MGFSSTETGILVIRLSESAESLLCSPCIFHHRITLCGVLPDDFMAHHFHVLVIETLYFVTVHIVI
jgi:hypothetical protein